MRSVRSSLASPATFESLESRQLLSANMTAAFVGAVPAVVLPDRIAQTTLRVLNTGATATRTRVELFASPTRDVTPGATLLAESNPVAAGRKTVRLRFSSSNVPTGTFYMVAQLVEVANGSPSVLALTVAPSRTRFAAATVDLTAALVGLPPSYLYVAASQDTSTSALVRVSNVGTVPAVGTITASIFASTSTTFDPSAAPIGSVSLAHVRIPAGGSRVVQVPITFKAGTPFGGYTLFAKVEGSIAIAETRLANNLARASSAIVIRAAPVRTEGHHHHHQHDGGDPGLIGVIGVDDPIDSLDGSDSNPVDTGDGSASAPPTEPDAPTTQPTTQPDNSGDSPDTGSDGRGSDNGASSGADSSGGDASNLGDEAFQAVTLARNPSAQTIKPLAMNDVRTSSRSIAS